MSSVWIKREKVKKAVVTFQWLMKLCKILVLSLSKEMQMIELGFDHYSIA